MKLINLRERLNWWISVSIFVNIVIVLYIINKDTKKEMQNFQISMLANGHLRYNISVAMNNYMVNNDSKIIFCKTENSTSCKEPIVNKSKPNQKEQAFAANLKQCLLKRLKCHNKDYMYRIEQRGDYVVLKNYIKAEHGPIECRSSVTYTTHADYTYLGNLIPLLKRWQGPVSIALYASGDDFVRTISSIRYLRDCEDGYELVRRFVTFHIYYSYTHFPQALRQSNEILTDEFSVNCSLPPPYVNAKKGDSFKAKNNLLYPINIGRNIAREAALTHFVLASDIELYPSPGLIQKFLIMICRNKGSLRRKRSRVFPLSIFEIRADKEVPDNKTALVAMLKERTAIPFHVNICPSCQTLPRAQEWKGLQESKDLRVFHIGKRKERFSHWEPIFIGTNDDPYYDERLNWYGQHDKLTQGFILCLLDYEFHILDNAFLVHKPGIKIFKEDIPRQIFTIRTRVYIRKVILPELKLLYGEIKGCEL